MGMVVISLIFRFCIFFLLFNHGVTFACVYVDYDTYASPAKLVKASDSILLATAVSKNSKGVSLETDAVLKGKYQSTIFISEGRFVNKKGYRDYATDDHSSLNFWLDETGSAPVMPDCSLRKDFIKGDQYLIFLGTKSVRSYERVLSSKDLWLSAVKRLVKGEQAAAFTLSEFLDKLDTLLFAKCEPNNDSNRKLYVITKSILDSGVDNFPIPVNHVVDCRKSEVEFVLLSWENSPNVIVLPIEKSYILFSASNELSDLVGLEKVRVNELLDYWEDN